MLQKSQVERCEYQDDSYIHQQPFPEPVPEEQEIHTDHDGCQQHYIKYDRCLSRHFSHQSKLKAICRSFLPPPEENYFRPFRGDGEPLARRSSSRLISEIFSRYSFTRG